MVGGGREEQEELSIGMTVLGINGIFTPATSCHDTCNTHTHNHKVYTTPVTSPHCGIRVCGDEVVNESGATEPQSIKIRWCARQVKHIPC